METKEDEIDDEVENLMIIMICNRFSLSLTHFFVPSRDSLYLFIFVFGMNSKLIHRQIFFIFFHVYYYYYCHHHHHYRVRVREKEKKNSSKNLDLLFLFT